VGVLSLDPIQEKTGHSLKPFDTWLKTWIAKRSQLEYSIVNEPKWMINGCLTVMIDLHLHWSFATRGPITSSFFYFSEAFPLFRIRQLHDQELNVGKSFEHLLSTSCWWRRPIGLLHVSRTKNKEDFTLIHLTSAETTRHACIDSWCCHQREAPSIISYLSSDFSDEENFFANRIWFSDVVFHFWIDRNCYSKVIRKSNRIFKTSLVKLQSVYSWMWNPDWNTIT
jgi:hypothetical protein